MKLGTESLWGRTKARIPQCFTPRVRDVVLSVSPMEEDSRALGELIAPSHCTLQPARDRDHARSLLDQHAVAVVVSEQDLPDGTWRNVQEDLRQLPEPPVLVVASRSADERLWLEVLESGGFDVLVKPWRPDEVRRVLASALRRYGHAAGIRTHWLRAGFAR